MGTEKGEKEKILKSWNILKKKIEILKYNSTMKISTLLMLGVDASTNRTLAPRIINGDRHHIAEYPWLVSLWAPSSDDFPSHCGGAILHQNWILTAAHCLFAEAQRASFMKEIKGDDWNRSLFVGDSIKVGMTYQDKSSEADGVYEKRIISGHCHENFDVDSQGELYADICLLRIDTILDHEFKSITGSTQKKICLPRSDSPPIGCYVAGWGLTNAEDAESESNHLLASHMPLIPHETCSAWYAIDGFELERDEHKCFGHEDGLHDSCQGDSGGPAMCYNSAFSQWEVHGLVSFADRCGAPKRPGVYTNVFNYAPWIHRTINEFHPEANFTDATCGEETLLFFPILLLTACLL